MYFLSILGEAFHFELAIQGPAYNIKKGGHNHAVDCWESPVKEICHHGAGNNSGYGPPVHIYGRS